MPYRNCPDCGFEYHARGPRDAPGVRVCEHVEEKVSEECTCQPKEGPVATAKRRYLAWDIEISKVLPDGETDWLDHMPLGISCMATYAQGESGPRVWHGSGGPPPPPAMSRDDLCAFVDYLRNMASDGYTILTWNGLSFDWHQLAFESGLHAECCELANSHVDVMFQVHCLKGFPIGLDAVCKGMRLPGKPEGMDGAQAPVLWQAGEYAKVLEYVAQDAKATLAVGMAIERHRGLAWISKSGRRNVLSIPKLLTVAEALRLPEPNNSWMDSPIPRNRFVQWMDQPTTQRKD